MSRKVAVFPNRRYGAIKYLIFELAFWGQRTMEAGIRSLFGLKSFLLHHKRRGTQTMIQLGSALVNGDRIRLAFLDFRRFQGEAERLIH